MPLAIGILARNLHHTFSSRNEFCFAMVSVDSRQLQFVSLIQDSCCSGFPADSGTSVSLIQGLACSGFPAVSGTSVADAAAGLIYTWTSANLTSDSCHVNTHSGYKKTLPLDMRKLLVKVIANRSCPVQRSLLYQF